MNSFEHNSFTDYKEIPFEPAGWFFLWSGLDHLVYFSKSKKADLVYFNKMAEAVIRFDNLQ
jgi:hypothetical protein